MGTREMKDSGIEWIGEIPKDWEVIRLRFLCEINTGNQDTINKVDGGLYPFFVRSPKIERINTYEYDGEAVLMAGDGVGAGKVFHYYNGKFNYHQRVYNFHKFVGVYGKFLFYYMPANFSNKIEEGGAKSTVDSVRLPWLKDFPICVPPVDKQHCIATFLDEKCKDIDTLITLQEEMIAELQAYKQSVISEAVTKGLNPNVSMKDSGVEWIGEVPEHWEMCRLKNKVILNPNFNSSLKNSDVVSFMPMQCLRNDMIIPQQAIYENVKNYTHFQNGDIVMAKVTPCFENGNIAIAKNLVNDNGFGTSEIFVLRCSESYFKRYFFYFLQIPYIKGVGCASMTGTGGLKRVNPTILNTSKLLVPPFPEQQAIADYLDTKCSQIDELIALKQQKITELQDYKKSLIYEYVTGKKEVPANN